jgi:hypothetical protein
VQESGSFRTTQKVPKKSYFWEKSDFSNRVPKRAQEIRCPRNPILGKNRISQTVCPNVPKKSVAQEIRFWGKIGFLKPCAQTCPRNPLPKKSDFGEKSDFSNRVPKRTQEIRFF